MKKRLLYFGLAVMALFSLTLMSTSAGSPGGRTGSPSDGQTCATAGCHGAIPPNGQDMIATNIPAGGYMPDSTYEISVTVSDANSGKFGFEMVAEDESGDKSGIFTGNVEVTSYASNQRVTHKSSSNTGTGSRTWTVDWTAPSAGTGAITFYTAALIANGNGNNSGDFVVVDSREYLEQGVASSYSIRPFEFKLYPNPSSDFIYLEGLDGGFKIDIFDNQGQLVLSSNKRQTNIQSLAAGKYIVKLKKGELVSSQIIVKQ